MDLKQIKQRFKTKYPNGWKVQGNQNPEWISFMDDTDCGGGNTSYYYNTNFEKTKNEKILFYYSEILKKETLISVDEFLSLWNNINQELTYEIY